MAMASDTPHLTQRWNPMRALLVACAGKLLIVLGSTAVSLFAVDAAKRDVEVLARDAQRETALIGELRRKLTRARALMLDVQNESDEAALDVAARGPVVAEQLRSIAETVDELTPMLGPPQQQIWAQLEPRLREAVTQLERVWSALAA